MSNTKKVIAFAICLGLMFPALSSSQAMARDFSPVGNLHMLSGSDDDEDEVEDENEDESDDDSAILPCTNTLKDSRKAHKTAIKTAEKTMKDAIKTAEKTFKDAIKSGSDKVAARTALKSSIEAARTTFKTVKSAANTELKDDAQELKDCKKGPRSEDRNSKREKAKVMSACIKTAHQASNEAVKAAELAFKAVRQGDPTDDELSAAKEVLRSAKKAAHDAEKTAREACKAVTTTPTTSA